jgi:hypothetical protein
MLASPTGTRGDSRPRAITTSASAISNSSSRSSLTTSTAQPRSASPASSWRMRAAAPTSSPQVGCATSSTFGAASISRPTMNFWRLPPERLAAGASGPSALMSNRSMSPAASRRAGPRRTHPPRPTSSRRVSRVFPARDSDGTDPCPIRSSGT